MEPVFRTLEIAAKALVRLTGTDITFQNLENIPATGGVVIAINHTSYVDWLPAGLAVHYRGRRIRYMIKAEMQQVKVVNFLIKHTKTIPVDRAAGKQAYAVAVQRLREGEVVGLMPEATISRSFELKEFKTGAARMALEAQVPIVPLIVWGTQRIWTKDHPRNLGRKKIPVTVAAGPPLAPRGGVEELETALRDEMTSLLHRVQEEYPHPEGAFWVPRRLGGGAPTLDEAKVLEEAERAERARKRGA
ncbi:lysophospholipid acyltransferase family protein [Mycobacterium shimoidei]|uniref:Putative acyltransferase [Mycobacterium tuberculosis H37Rv] n=1 Tax=Mycobacterium shimoidei TaxID=29313 RepID=A0A1E3TL64_MYCSH|nr:lysophospholipid acyltransferase family protein [Mycobacterium shimoidei]MCV7258915.1 1-acyl-sn-glycerol-3-phosphate acyltransferase [Mycobacterium shimoidei]ODR15206.1 acyltransferase [Mycobacterium shimoidei]ORW79785.1 acyltransferase [Mycobacterium shimoidei]SRX92972.1 putative acyltransferase [Mycobacterium tuberculosis H37Rv] [Mycobacterium shimoidei]